MELNYTRLRTERAETELMRTERTLEGLRDKIGTTNGIIHLIIQMASESIHVISAANDVLSSMDELGSSKQRLRRILKRAIRAIERDMEEEEKKNSARTPPPTCKRRRRVVGRETTGGVLVACRHTAALALA